MALLYNVNAFAEPAINVWLRCANGIHATIRDDVLTAEGVMTLPFEHTENETDQQKRWSSPTLILKQKYKSDIEDQHSISETWMVDGLHV